MELGIPKPLPVLPSGLRFHPTEGELVGYYLRRKVDGALQDDESAVIPEANLVLSDPWDLVEKHSHQAGDKECIVFWRYQYKYSTTFRAKRCTPSGYWKATGLDRPVVVSNRKIGMRKSLVFYSGKPPGGQKTGWLMYEYRLEGAGVSREGDHVVCRITHKTSTRHPFEFAQPARDGGKALEGVDTRTVELGFVGPSSLLSATCPSLLHLESAASTPLLSPVCSPAISQEIWESKPCASASSEQNGISSIASVYALPGSCAVKAEPMSPDDSSLPADEARDVLPWLKSTDFTMIGRSQGQVPQDSEGEEFSWKIEEIQLLLQA